MKKHPFIAGLMGATLLAAIPPAGAAPPEHAGPRWGEQRADRPAPQRAPRQGGPDRSFSPDRGRPGNSQVVDQRPGMSVDRENRFERYRNGPYPRDVADQQRREIRRDWRQDDRNDRRDWYRDNRNDRHDWRDDDRRDDRRDWQRARNDWREDRHDWNDRRIYRPAPRYDWNHDWRQDRRYDWRDFRGRYQDRYRYRYYAPRGWNDGYRRFSIGISIWSGLYVSRYWISDPWYYRLPPAYGSLRWVRYYDDALLIDIRTGYVVDVIYDFFW